MRFNSSMMYRELRRRARKIIGPTLSSCLAGYFCYHMIAGKHGTMAWREINTELSLAKAKLASLKADQHKLEHHVQLLRPSSLCADLLDEQSRKVLGYTQSNEIVILHHHDN